MADILENPQHPKDPRSSARFSMPTLPEGAFSIAKYKSWIVFAAIVVMVLLMFFQRSTTAPAPARNTVANGQQPQPAITPQDVSEYTNVLAAQNKELDEKQKQEAAARAALQNTLGMNPDGTPKTVAQATAERNNQQVAGYSTAQRAYSGNSSGEHKPVFTGSLVLVSDPQPKQTVSPASQVTSAENLNQDAAVKKPEEKKANPLDFDLARGKYILPEGFVIETVLTNKLVGDATGPVDCMVTTPVYAPGTHQLIFPQGVRVIGRAESVSGFGQSRLLVKFHRILVQKQDRFYSVPLDDVSGLDQQGAAGLKDKVNNHLLSTLLVSGAIGAIAGLSEIGNQTSGFGINPMAEFRAGVTQSMGQSAQQVFQQYSNRKPTITIRPGTRVKLIMISDVRVPSYADGVATQWP